MELAEAESERLSEVILIFVRMTAAMLREKRIISPLFLWMKRKHRKCGLFQHEFSDLVYDKNRKDCEGGLA